jgi:hypothetical protein
MKRVLSSAFVFLLGFLVSCVPAATDKYPDPVVLHIPVSEVMEQLIFAYGPFKPYLPYQRTLESGEVEYSYNIPEMGSRVGTLFDLRAPEKTWRAGITFPKLSVEEYFLPNTIKKVKERISVDSQNINTEFIIVTGKLKGTCISRFIDKDLKSDQIFISPDSNECS